MSRRNAHLADADWRLTQAGTRLEALLSVYSIRGRREGIRLGGKIPSG